jgi:hypothetical protein
VPMWWQEERTQAVAVGARRVERRPFQTRPLVLPTHLHLFAREVEAGLRLQAVVGNATVPSLPRLGRSTAVR